MLRQTDPPDLKDLQTTFDLYGRTITEKNLKFYLLRNKGVTKNYKDHRTQHYLKYLAVPKYRTRSEIEECVVFIFSIEDEQVRDWSLNDTQLNEYLFGYGDFYFRRFLNSLDSYESREERLIINFENQDKYLPNLVLQKIDPPFDRYDYSRREKIVEKEFLEFCLKTPQPSLSPERLNNEFLLEQCFCEQFLLDNVINFMWENKYTTVRLREITPKGIGYLKSLYEKEVVNQNPNSNEVFIAQSFAEPLLQHFKLNVEPILVSMGFKPIIINQADTNTSIDIEILKRIDSSLFVMCDLTLERPSVYCEAGYAIGKNKKVFLTARFDHNTDCEGWKAGDPKVHFDLRNRQITWWDPVKSREFQDELKERIERWKASVDNKMIVEASI